MLWSGDVEKNPGPGPGPAAAAAAAINETQIKKSKLSHSQLQHHDDLVSLTS